MLRVVSLDLGFHVVIGVGRLNVQQDGFNRQLHFTTHTLHQVQSSFFLNVSCHDPLNLYPEILAYFSSRKTGLLRCEGDGDVVSVVTPLVRGGAQVFAWRSGCRAQCAARSAGEGRRRRGR